MNRGKCSLSFAAAAYRVTWQKRLDLDQTYVRLDFFRPNVLARPQITRLGFQTKWISWTADYRIWLKPRKKNLSTLCQTQKFLLRTKADLFFWVTCSLWIWGLHIASLPWKIFHRRSVYLQCIELLGDDSGDSHFTCGQVWSFAMRD